MEKQIMVIGFLIIILAGLTVFFFTDSAPEQTTDNCTATGGTWEEFSDACADTCGYRRGETTMCAQVLTNSCNCGPGKCWNEDACVPI